METKGNIKSTITSKFRDKLWDDKELEKKEELRYYKEVWLEMTNPTLANKNFVFVLTSSKKEMNIEKIITKSQEL